MKGSRGGINYYHVCSSRFKGQFQLNNKYPDGIGVKLKTIPCYSLYPVRINVKQ